MRNFFINALDAIIGILAILMVLGVLFLSYTALNADPETLSGMEIAGIPVPSGALGAAITFVLGMVQTIIVIGFLYIGTGIYKNTKRTADAVEAMISE